MDYLALLLTLSFMCTCIHFLIKILGARTFGDPVTLPPGPRSLPLIGNILDLGNKPHQTLANLSKTYGPIMTIKLGSLTSIVISSPDIAKEALKKNDRALSSRTLPDTFRALDHHKVSMVWLPVSVPWTNLRKICTSQMFTTKRLDANQVLLRKNVRELLDYVQQNCNNGCAVDIGQAFFTTVLNLISNTFFSIDLAQYHSDLSQSFNELACCVMEEAGNPNLADYFPALRFLDPQGSRKRMTKYLQKTFRIIDDIINERLKVRASSMNSESKDVLDSLLNIAEENNSKLSRSDIKHLLLDLFFAGIDTTSRTVEWAMAELLHNPEKLTKAQIELRELASKEGIVEEFDISKFPYLRAIVKETFRLHPPAPCLVPRKAEVGVNICGFKVPKNSQVLVNIWAIGRDSSIWPDPNSFMPERFLESKIDIKGQDFELIPFGAGKRSCPGIPLANRMLPFMLASLIYTFNWKLADGLKPEDLDMSEKFGLTLHKATPLLAIPIKA